MKQCASTADLMIDFARIVIIFGVICICLESANITLLACGNCTMIPLTVVALLFTGRHDLVAPRAFDVINVESERTPMPPCPT